MALPIHEKVRRRADLLGFAITDDDGHCNLVDPQTGTVLAIVSGRWALLGVLWRIPALARRQKRPSAEEFVREVAVERGYTVRESSNGVEFLGGLRGPNHIAGSAPSWQHALVALLKLPTVRPTKTGAKFEQLCAALGAEKGFNVSERAAGTGGGYRRQAYSARTGTLYADCGEWDGLYRFLERVPSIASPPRQHVPDVEALAREVAGARGYRLEGGNGYLHIIDAAERRSQFGSKPAAVARFWIDALAQLVELPPTAAAPSPSSPPAQASAAPASAFPSSAQSRSAEIEQRDARDAMTDDEREAAEQIEQSECEVCRGVPMEGCAACSPPGTHADSRW